MIVHPDQTWQNRVAGHVDGFRFCRNGRARRRPDRRDLSAADDDGLVFQRRSTRAINDADMRQGNYRRIDTDKLPKLVTLAKHNERKGAYEDESKSKMNFHTFIGTTNLLRTNPVEYKSDRFDHQLRLVIHDVMSRL